MKPDTKAPKDEQVLNVDDTVEDVSGRRGIVRSIWVKRGGEVWARVEFVGKYINNVREAPADCFRLVRP